MEHVERQEEREGEIRDSVDELERRGDELEQHGDDVEQQIGSVRQEWESKQRAEDVPGAQEPGAHGQGSGPPAEADIAPGDEDEVAEGDTDQATGNPPNDDSPAADERD